MRNQACIVWVMVAHFILLSRVNGEMDGRKVIDSFDIESIERAGDVREFEISVVDNYEGLIDSAYYSRQRLEDPEIDGNGVDEHDEDGVDRGKEIGEDAEDEEDEEDKEDKIEKGEEENDEDHNGNELSGNIPESPFTPGPRGRSKSKQAPSNNISDGISPPLTILSYSLKWSDNYYNTHRPFHILKTAQNGRLKARSIELDSKTGPRSIAEYHLTTDAKLNPTSRTVIGQQLNPSIRSEESKGTHLGIGPSSAATMGVTVAFAAYVLL